VRLHDLVIEESDAAKIDEILMNFLRDSGATEALLIDRSGQPLAMRGKFGSLDPISISALAAGAFASTGAMAQLLGEPEFTVLFHQGVKANIYVSTVDDHTILMAIFGESTTVGMVRLFAREAIRAIETVLTEARTRSRQPLGLGGPLSADEAGSAFRELPTD
jgi:predicted regulator of Ras-like GTPase activity (Roadblock/LC7/MglB family)